MSRMCRVGLPVIVLLLLAGLKTTPAADLPTKPTKPADYGQIVAHIFELAAEGKVDDAVDYSQVAKRISREDADVLRGQLARPAQQGWKYLDSEVAASKTVTSRVQEIYVMAHYDQAPVLLIVRFYRADDGWFIQHLRFPENMKEFIDSLPYDKVAHREGR